MEEGKARGPTKAGKGFAVVIGLMSAGLIAIALVYHTRPGASAWRLVLDLVLGIGGVLYAAETLFVKRKG